jgi:hypothetical protein
MIHAHAHVDACVRAPHLDPRVVQLHVHLQQQRAAQQRAHEHGASLTTQRRVASAAAADDDDATTTTAASTFLPLSNLLLPCCEPLV